MKTFIYKINPGKLSEYKFYFKATCREQADRIVKANTKRGSESEFIGSTTAGVLQRIPEIIHTDKSETQNYMFFFTCPECGRTWTRSQSTSITFQTRCPNTRFHHSTQNNNWQHVSYRDVYLTTQGAS